MRRHSMPSGSARKSTKAKCDEVTSIHTSPFPKGSFSLTRDGLFFIEVSKVLFSPLFQFGDRHFDQIHLGRGEPFPELLRPKVEGVPGAEAELADQRVEASQAPGPLTINTFTAWAGFPQGGQPSRCSYRCGVSWCFLRVACCLIPSLINSGTSSPSGMSSSR